MNIFPQDPKFIIGAVGFGDRDDNDQPLDLLNRREFGQRLTEVVDRFEQPLVIALDGAWGSGKSHFLKLWAGGHKLELGGQAEVIYFDAFEHDYLDDPLVSLIGRLAKDVAPAKFSEAALKKVKTAAAPLLKLSARVAIAVATSGASEFVGAVGDAALAAVGRTADEKIDAFWAQESGRLAAMQQFRDALEALTLTPAGTPQKIVFIIDELDRCRPDYALNLLEIIKHFFAVPNVHFVLGVNLTALGNSVKARYGQGVDAHKYLQKFVMLTMTLPEMVQDRQDLSVAKDYFHKVAAQFIASQPRIELLDEHLAPFFGSGSVNIRDIQRILSVTALLPVDSQHIGFGYRSLLIGAAILKVLEPEAYRKLRNHSLTLDEAAKTLHLTPWRQAYNGSSPNHIWIIWALMLANQERVLAEGIPEDQASRYRNAFSDFGEAFDWQTAEALLSDAFDMFSLPGA